MVPDEAAAAIEGTIARLREQVATLVRERDEARSLAAQRERENLDLLDELHEAREQAARMGAL